VPSASTAPIRATFGVTPEGHKKIKGLAKLKTGDNLRHHMTDLELIFTMLGEASNTEIARRKEAQGFPANRRSAREGGTIAGNAREALEAKSGQPVVSASNNLFIARGAAALGGKVVSKTLAGEPAMTLKSKLKVPAKVLATAGKKARGG
jgi:DNA-damage-inducible protein D